jgi:hypothetical protein
MATLAARVIALVKRPASPAIVGLVREPRGDRAPRRADRGPRDHDSTTRMTENNRDTDEVP